MYKTKDIIIEFMKIKLEQRGEYDWFDCKPHSKEKNNKKKNEQIKEYINDIGFHEFEEILSTLDRISNALIEFIREDRSQSDLFTNMTDQLIDNFKYKNFETLADEVFSEGITWSHIVTVIVFSLECATKILEKDIYFFERDFGKDDVEVLHRRRGETIYQLIDWLVKYFQYKIEDWISKEGGWTKMKVLEEKEGLLENNSDINKSNFKQYFGVATIAVLASTLYFCSRF